MIILPSLSFLFDFSLVLHFAHRSPGCQSHSLPGLNQNGDCRATVSAPQGKFHSFFQIDVTLTWHLSCHGIAQAQQELAFYNSMAGQLWRSKLSCRRRHCMKVKKISYSFICIVVEVCVDTNILTIDLSLSKDIISIDAVCCLSCRIFNSYSCWHVSDHCPMVTHMH